MTNKIIIPGENPQRAKYDWLSQEIARLEKLIQYNQAKTEKLQGQTVKTINELVKTMNTSLNLQQPRRTQDKPKK